MIPLWSLSQAPDSARNHAQAPDFLRNSLYLIKTIFFGVFCKLQTPSEIMHKLPISAEEKDEAKDEAKNEVIDEAKDEAIDGVFRKLQTPAEIMCNLPISAEEKDEAIDEAKNEAKKTSIKLKNNFIYQK